MWYKKGKEKRSDKNGFRETTRVIIREKKK